MENEIKSQAEIAFVGMEIVILNDFGYCNESGGMLYIYNNDDYMLMAIPILQIKHISVTKVQ